MIAATMASEPPEKTTSARDLYYNNPLTAAPASPTTQARKVLAERGELLLAATTTDDEDVEDAALYTEFVLSDNEDSEEEVDEVEDDDDEDVLPRGAYPGEDVLLTSSGHTKEPPQQQQQQPPPPPPPLLSTLRASLSSPRGGGGRAKNSVDALLVDDKPWRNTSRKTPPQFKQQPAPTTTQQQPQAPLSPMRGSTLLGYITGQKAGGAAVSETVATTTAAKDKADKDDDEDWWSNQDLVVEAVSQPSSDGSSFGDNDETDSRSWVDWLPPDGDNNNEGNNAGSGFEWERPVSFETMAAEYPSSQVHFCHTAGAYHHQHQQQHQHSSLSSSNHNGEGAITTTSTTMTGDLFSQKRASHFVWQQGMLLHAALQLLVERDHLGVEGNMDSSDNVWKKGPLKKWATGKGPGKWKVKYVEVRKGNIVYYDDGSGFESPRKSIHLRSSDTVCAAVTDSNTGLAANNNKHVFEIVQTGSPKFLFMARSDEDCQAWILAIQAAMIGNNMDTTVVDNSHLSDDETSRGHEVAIGRYKTLQARLIMVDVHDDYVSNVNELSAEGVLRIPVSWIRQQVQDLGGKGSKGDNDRFNPTLTSAKGNSSDPQKLIRASISEFLSNMRDTAFAVNGSVMPLEAPFLAERVFGSLTRCLLEYDHAFVQESDVEQDPSSAQISELQAVSYARDILVAVLRTREQQDVLYAVNDLLRSDDLVVVSAVPEEEIIQLEVSLAGDDWRVSAGDPSSGQLATWLRTRKKGSPGWRKRFAVLSGVVLSYYESATPRPHGLKSQLVLDGNSTVSMLDAEERNLQGEPWLLLVSTKNESRYLSFENEQDLKDWSEALKDVVSSCNTDTDDDTAAHSHKFRVPRAIKGGGKKMFNFARSLRPGGGSGGGGTPTAPLLQNVDSPLSDPVPPTPPPPRTHPTRPSMNMLMQQQVGGGGKREPTVQCVAQHVHQFVVKDRFDDSQVLFSVYAKLFQAFTCSGGPHGSLSQGNNTLVEIAVSSAGGGPEEGASSEGGGDKFQRVTMFM